MQIRVDVKTGQKREQVVENRDLLEVCLKVKAERGEANTRLRQIIAEYYDLPLANVRIISGFKKPRKLLLINASCHEKT